VRLDRGAPAKHTISEIVYCVDGWNHCRIDGDVTPIQVQNRGHVPHTNVMRRTQCVCGTWHYSDKPCPHCEE